ncbi:uncharacterized protein LOC129767185 [Toxorhynchites rutilus septentrionalis]|uniref:uncharacterized protein LOC129767185 n=1 Tax=Toxorhynchites rutilus septentrionalis TaxID=329112 RepID=UPI00247A29AA|nr:uncharacterized protein LOC129767185 [Toxorhynchites rutilus septentrionalis]
MSDETLQMINAAIYNGTYTSGTLIRSKLTNRPIWNSSDQDENDPVKILLLAIIGADIKQEQETQKENGKNGVCANGTNITTKISMQQDGINKWKQQWEILKNADDYCCFCENNNERNENSQFACPYLRARFAIVEENPKTGL